MKLGVEIGRIFRNGGQGVIDLVIEANVMAVDIFYGHATSFGKWHEPVPVKGSAWINTHSKRGNRRWGILQMDIPDHPRRSTEYWSATCLWVSSRSVR